MQIKNRRRSWTAFRILGNKIKAQINLISVQEASWVASWEMYEIKIISLIVGRVTKYFAVRGWNQTIAIAFKVKNCSIVFFLVFAHYTQVFT